MVFWLTVLALTAAAIVIGFRPMLRGSGSADLNRAEDHEHDIAVYRHQLEELAGEEARGSISPVEAAQARNEISRRILAVEDRMSPVGTAGKPARAPRSGLAMLGLFALVFVPGLTLIIYTGIGSPGYESQPLAMRLDTTYPWARSGAANSPAYLARPVTLAGPSIRLSGLPTKVSRPVELKVWGFEVWVMAGPTGCACR